ncbi:efflux transporter outer membrane subunit [Massilia atriviolacea]|uniref:Efflux transporter outer membrane subunit n=1 Tax=Massilia atriviolacea TaxID=2495579 RepID=A0A430HET7_9BURK|nr:efflux transporter outer membrane subunit [Massilia atriviolacea]RSZ56026.1 efflux transporter outer membrane subunit [Massilia atriviolacea]
MKIVHVLSAALLPLTLGACTTAPPTRTEAPVPPQWQTPLPHNGSLTDLANWWREQGDPLLAQLVEAAQTASPNVATARSRIVQSRADRVAAGAALAPTLDAAASVSRANQQAAQPIGTTSQGGLQSAWEIDLFGGGRATRNAAEERLAGARANWHDARVAVAAEVANQYYSLRSCEQLLAVARLDAASREDTARLTGLSADAGFQAPATAALARASAAESKSRATLQRALCDIDIKTLVALTAIDEPELRARLLAGTPAAPPAPAIAALPAQVLAQRPDVFSAEREVAAASFEVGSAQAQRYPRLSLQGSIGRANLRSSGGENSQFDTWSIGPLALTLPIFDGGRRSANVDAAKARYDAAVVSYRASARRAVSEVEQALVNLNSAAERSADAQVSLDGYRVAFRAAEDRYKNGLGSLLELEDARRTRLAAENAVVTLQRERSAASVALYRAAGGGWTATPN